MSLSTLLSVVVVPKHTQQKFSESRLDRTFQGQGMTQDNLGDPIRAVVQSVGSN